jgi:hypothetical protein
MVKLPYRSSLALVWTSRASCARSAAKTYQEFLKLFKAVPYRFVFTATPSPNRYKELIHYAGFLGVMDTGEALTRFFQRDSAKANNLTLYPHMEKQFWLWLNSWAVFIQKPSDLGYSDEGYDLPEMKVHWHKLDVDHSKAWNQFDGWGQAQLFVTTLKGSERGRKSNASRSTCGLPKAYEIISHSRWASIGFFGMTSRRSGAIEERNSFRRRRLTARRTWRSAKTSSWVSRAGNIRILATKPSHCWKRLQFPAALR